jgi:hypothetical protein
MEIRPSARRHGVADEDIHHVLDHSLREVALDDERWLVLGPDRAANIIELVLYTTDQGEARVIHAMRATKEHLKFL